MYSTVVIGLDPSENAHHAGRDRAGLARAAIVEIANRVDADLIVIGNKGAHGARRILGSLARAVTDDSPCTEARALLAGC